jgi:hypothetical protein
VVIPTKYDVTIKIESIDVTSSVPSDSMSFDDYARQVSIFSFTLEKQGAITPARTNEVSMFANSTGEMIFIGNIVEIESIKRGITIEYEIECHDSKMRLQRTVIDANVLTGTDSEILQDLLDSSYPDLSDLFDFTTGVENLGEGLTFPVNNTNLLDALGDLSDLVGNSNWSMQNKLSTSTLAVTFETDDGSLEYYIQLIDPVIPPPSAELAPISPNIPADLSVITGGNPDNCVSITVTSLTGVGGIATLVRSSSSITVVSGSVDVFCSQSLLLTVRINGSGTTKNVSANTWATVDLADTGAFPKTDTVFVTRVFGNLPSSPPFDLRMDNVILNFEDGGGTDGYKPTLGWGGEIPTTDFNLDISSGDEYGSDYNLNEGGGEDYNSITVIGGVEDSSIDWTYESDGDLDHFNLETGVDDLVVFKNTGSDATPIWAEQILGVWGEDDFISAGGSSNVLYDDQLHWLFFDTNPSNFSKSIRITGDIGKPIRVRVENLSGNEPLYATTIVDKTITSQEQAAQIGLSKLDRQNAVTRLEFKTHNPGLKPGQAINVLDTVRGLDETLIIQKISTEWLGASGIAEFDVQCGNEEPDSADILIANNDRRSRENQLSGVTTTVSAEPLLNDDGENILNSDNAKIWVSE